MSAATDSAGHLVDEAARAAIAGELGSTLFVEAGAGTGKTTALVSRIVALVREASAELREVAAITFTEAAAFELRERIREAIARAAVDNPGDAGLARAVRQVDEAAIGTIHGFCHRVLAEHPLDAGLPLRFEVLDDIAAAIAFDRRFLSFLDELYDEADARVLLGAAACLQITPNQLRLLARQLDERWDELPDGDKLVESGGLAGHVEAASLAAIEAVSRALDQLVAFRGCCTEESDGLAQRIDELVPVLASVREVADWMDGLRFLSELRVRKVGNAGRRESWSTIEVQLVRSAFVELEAVRAEHLARLSDLVLSHLLVRLGTEARRAAAERRRAGALYFHDLLAIAYQLLGSNEAIRQQVRSRFSKILVDEFQDTDPLQLRIVLLLGAKEPGARPEEGRLFFVGDPKQSIYRFRGADVAAYAAAFSALGVAAPTRLVANFRSVPAILEWVNGVFSELLGEQGAYSPLEAVCCALGDEPAVTVIGGPTGEGVTAGQRRLSEAADVAEMVTRAVAEGWPVREGALVRPARFGDVAILVPRRTGLFSLERALEEQDIPYQVSSSTLVYGSAEVRDLRGALAAIAPGADERAVLGALRTPAFGCSDDELLEYRLAGGTFALGAARLATHCAAGHAWGGVAEALSALSGLHDDAYHLGVVGVLEELLRSRKVLALAAGAPRRREALRRIDFILERARAFSRSGGSDLAAFLSFLDLEAQLNVRSVELPASDEAGDVARILTVHGAKGLEFPIVVLTELGGPPITAARGPRVISGEGGRLEARVRSGLETAGFGARAADEEEAEIAEALRIAYVGATRARDHLVVCLHHQGARRPGARSIAERIAAVVGTSAPEAREMAADPGAPGSVAVTIGPPSGGAPLDLEQWRGERAELLARLGRPRSVAATGLVPPPRSEPRRRAPDEGGETSAWRRPRAATRVGRAVHRLLQEVPLAGGAPLGELARRAAEEEECAEEAGIVERLAEQALASPIVARAAASAKLWRELPLSAALDGGVLEAIIDLLFEDDNGEITIVDYKTDALSSTDEAASAASHYRSQVGAYALAVEGLLGRPVAEVVLLFLALPSGAIEHRVDDLAGAITEARRRAADVLAGAR